MSWGKREVEHVCWSPFSKGYMALHQHQYVIQVNSGTSARFDMHDVFKLRVGTNASIDMLDVEWSQTTQCFI